MQMRLVKSCMKTTCLSESMEMSAYMGTSKEGEQQDVQVCKQEDHYQTPRQDCGFKGDQGLVWQTGGLGQSRRDINQKEAIGSYEFTLTPRALFAPDGTILRCMDKSKLIHLLNKLTTTQPLPQDDELPEDGMDTTQNVPSRKIALVDGMVLPQQMAKSQRP